MTMKFFYFRPVCPSQRLYSEADQGFSERVVPPHVLAVKGGFLERKVFKTFIYFTFNFFYISKLYEKKV
jgi:hypothetical protein